MENDRWRNDMKTNLGEISYKNMKWTELPKDRVQW
jgi:hypothetical protein